MKYLYLVITNTDWNTTVRASTPEEACQQVRDMFIAFRPGHPVPWCSAFNTERS